MATDSAPISSLLSLLYRSYPHSVHPNATETDLPAIAATVFPEIIYSDADKDEVSKWIRSTSELTESIVQNDTESVNKVLESLNIHLSTRTTLLGAKPSVADVAVYALLGPVVEKWTPEERTGENGYHHIVRYVDFVQNADLFGLRIPSEEKITVDVDDVKTPPKFPKPAKEEKVKKDKNARMAAAAARGQGGLRAAEKEKELVVGKGKDAAGKEKTPKQPKQPKQPAKPAAPLSPSIIDLRVGHILRAVQHPNADSLYVSTINCGDAQGADNTSVDEETGLTVRTVCSGLNGLVPLEEMQGRKIVAVCNLKPVTMRGIKSAAMVLAASPRDADGHGGPVEIVSPPEGAETGERMFFEGWSEGEPEKVLNPKKKMWETFQPGFTTSDSLEVGFDSSAVPQLEDSSGTVGKLVAKSGGVATVKSLKGAAVR